tara:strand:- start:174 stop:473 length:300 start_codon:yes stop_codon:yes gene_type:complete
MKHNNKPSLKKDDGPIWERQFDRIPEVLTIQEVAQYLRIEEAYVQDLVDKESIRTIPGTNNQRIFKGFLFAFLTQNPPKQIGLLGGMPGNNQDLPSIGF